MVEFLAHGSRHHLLLNLLLSQDKNRVPPFVARVGLILNRRILVLAFGFLREIALWVCRILRLRCVYSLEKSTFSMITL